MFLVKAVMSGIGETLFLRYNLQGDAEAAYTKMQQRMLYTEAAEVDKPVTEEFTDDHGVRCMVPGYGILFCQIIDLGKFADADARQNVGAQAAFQKEATRVQQGQGIIPAVPGGLLRPS